MKTNKMVVTRNGRDSNQSALIIPSLTIHDRHGGVLEVIFRQVDGQCPEIRLVRHVRFKRRDAIENVVHGVEDGARVLILFTLTRLQYHINLVPPATQKQIMKHGTDKNSSFEHQTLNS